jgi:hypothetical protein
MTKLTALDLYILTDTIIHSLQFGSSWSGVATFDGEVWKSLWSL